MRLIYMNNIKKHQPTILIEILNDEIGHQVQSLIQDMNYLYFNIDEDLGVKKVDRILKSDSFNYLLCTKKVAEDIGIIMKEEK